MIDEVVLDRLGPKEIVAREHATGVPLFYRLNADARSRRAATSRRERGPAPDMARGAN